MSIILVVFGILVSMVLSTFSGVQIKAGDTERTTDIKALHGQVEAYYAQYGYYPDQKSFDSQALTLFKGLDSQALIDPNGKKIDQGGDYTYKPDKCVKNECQTYTLTTKLNAGGTYTKSALN